MSAPENASHVDNDSKSDPESDAESDATSGAENASGAAAFRKCVLEQVAAIPTGRVMTYGEVALLAGRPGTARRVGGVLFGLSEREAETVPWHRVINAQGRLSTYKVGSGELQRALLEAEGVAFNASGRLELKRYGCLTDFPAANPVRP